MTRHLSVLQVTVPAQMTFSHTNTSTRHVREETYWKYIPLVPTFPALIQYPSYSSDPSQLTSRILQSRKTIHAGSSCRPDQMNL